MVRASSNFLYIYIYIYKKERKERKERKKKKNLKRIYNRSFKIQLKFLVTVSDRKGVFGYLVSNGRNTERSQPFW